MVRILRAGRIESVSRGPPKGKVMKPSEVVVPKASDAVVPTKKKRGRPRKNPIVAPPSPTSSLVTPSPSVVINRPNEAPRTSSSVAHPPIPPLVVKLPIPSSAVQQKSPAVVIRLPTLAPRLASLTSSLQPPVVINRPNLAPPTSSVPPSRATVIKHKASKKTGMKIEPLPLFPKASAVQQKAPVVVTRRPILAPRLAPLTSSVPPIARAAVIKHNASKKTGMKIEPLPLFPTASVARPDVTKEKVERRRHQKTIDPATMRDVVDVVNYLVNKTVDYDRLN